MSSVFMSTKDKETLNRFISGLCLQSTQIIVQGRIGKPISTQSIPQSVGSRKWIPFNLAIKDFPEVRHQAAAALSNGLPSLDNTYVIEVSLRTSDADALVLEVWSIGVTNKCEDEFYESMVYDHILLLLKSLLCISRTTPAYKLSRRQGNEYVICYRVYTGKISLVGLGEGFKTLKVGTVSTPVGTITISAAYRTTENLHVSTERLSPGFDLLFDVQEDHFSLSGQPTTSPARPCATLQSRLRTLSETSEGFMDNSPSFNTFNVSHSRSSRRQGSDKDDEDVRFTVGTPPSGQGLVNRSSTSPALATIRQGSAYSPEKSGECLPSCRTGHHSSNCVKVLASHKKQRRKETSIPVPGSSAPSLHCFYKKEDVTYPVGGAGTNRRISIPRINSNHKTTAKACHPQSPSEARNRANSGTRYCHWNNSNATKITAENSSNGSIQKLTVHDLPKSGKEKWVRTSNVSIEDKYTNPPALETGAFVLGGKSRSKPNLSPSDAVPSDLPFLDLISAIEDDDDSGEDNMSQDSDSSPDTSPDRESGLESGKRSLTSSSAVGRDSSNSLSSGQSQDGTKVDTRQKRAKDDFVMVDLNPAFARDESIEDLSTFYKECKNAPELSMFEEQQRDVTEQPTIDLSKRIDDYQRDIADFDEFVNKMIKC